MKKKIKNAPLEKNTKERKELRKDLREKRKAYKETLKENNLTGDKKPKDPELKKKLRRDQLAAAVADKKLKNLEKEAKVLKKPKTLPDKLKEPRNLVMYDYPEINGQPLDRGQRKKYRRAIRKYLKTMDKRDAEKYAIKALTNYALNKAEGTKNRDYKVDAKIEKKTTTEKVTKLPEKKKVKKVKKKTIED